MSKTAARTILKKNDAGKVKRERVYDYLYDPVYTVCSEVDHSRSSLRAYAAKGRVQRVPEFESMFSNLPHHPRFAVQLDPVDPVPVFIDRRWRGHSEQHKKALQLVAGIIPNSQSWLKKEECHVTGTDRWKYFKRPLIPFEQQLPPDGIFASQRDDFIFTHGNTTDIHPTRITVGVQTDYRENEAQTEPYSPEYVVYPGTTPAELLQLAALTWGHGLPAGTAEVEMIQRARAKRAWEATLPPLDDLSQLDRRRHMMEEMNVQEWAFREAEIQKLQEARLVVLKGLLRQRNEVQKEATSERMNRLYAQLQNDSETRRQKIHNDYTRSLRKLEAKRRNMAGKLERLGTIRRDMDSKIYNPLIHCDISTNKNTKRMINSHYLHTYEGLQKLEPGLLKRPKPKVNTINDVIKPQVSRALRLMEKYETLREEVKDHVAEKPLRFLVKKEKPVVRPATPRVDEPPAGEEEKELALIYLQKLLRGRSVQYKMLKAMKNQMELIQELKTVNALQKEEQELQMADKELVMTLRRQREKARHEKSQEEASQAGMVGAELQHLFDTLSKELIHLQEEHRIHAFVLLAERDRRLREAEESGKRQVEERRRREEDEIFRQVVRVHQETVDLYLEEIILGTLEHTADQQAREEIHRKAQEVNNIALAMEESRNRLQSEEIVSELVYSFLIPEVEKTRVRQRVHQRQQRHLQAAQSVIQETTELFEIQSTSSSGNTNQDGLNSK